MNQPARLHKIENESVNDKIECFALRYANIIVPLALIILVLLFVALAYVVIGVSAVESGTYYYHLGDL